ncbi:hypothetical protein HBA55_00935 [Pseudomaricurvus alkylphenolicus]|jgi:hypothetical protein|uniref:hypothetical protein n=1 Tax=Pseudomaricurvus alkylphenolicus TaxID=1306991 RepID=UPI00142411EE|nr:hypothetical protein [Pseudomaricurvus alkylphenolicus]NIB38126.1 hypothetical protein [Pseudomaricurvus alkylphenolicus]
MLKQDVKKMTINNVIGNLAGHAGITYWIKHDGGDISAWGDQGYIADFLVTGFLFCGIVAAIFVFMYRGKVSRGEFDLHEVPSERWGSWLPANAWMAVLVIGLLGLVSAGLPLVGYLLAAGVQPLSPLAVALSKGIWAAMVSAIIVPVAIYHGASIATLKLEASQ